MRLFLQSLAVARAAAVLAAALTVPLFADGPTPSPTPAPSGAYPLSAYTAVGSSFAQSGHLSEMGWTPEQIDAFVEGVRAGLQGKTYPLDDAARQILAGIGRQVAQTENRRREAPTGPMTAAQLKQYMKDASKKMGLDEADSGLCYRIQFGSQVVRPGPADTVVINCAASAADGVTSLPDLSGKQVRVKVSSLLPGLAEGIQMLTVGSEAIFILPPKLSFGDGDWPQGVVRGTPLVFRVALVQVISAAPASAP